mmetsp:Transcript_29522/g.53803  ORF Transcript_29522/g.53803 Transcript_29522/m.53803 type:complete len:222 (+) Transcript_29522:2152-2817(+)
MRPRRPRAIITMNDSTGNRIPCASARRPSNKRLQSCLIVVMLAYLRRHSATRGCGPPSSILSRINSSLVLGTEAFTPWGTCPLNIPESENAIKPAREALSSGKLVLEVEVLSLSSSLSFKSKPLSEFIGERLPLALARLADCNCGRASRVSKSFSDFSCELFKSCSREVCTRLAWPAQARQDKKMEILLRMVSGVFGNVVYKRTKARSCRVNNQLGSLMSS